MTERELIVTTPGRPMRAFIAHPDGEGPFTVALLYMDAAGYREQFKENARRFAAEGYFCVAPDLWHHFGDDINFDMAKIAAAGFEGEEIEEMLRLAAELSADLVKSDTDATLAAIESDPAASEGPKVCVGYCMGARFALHAASKLPDEFVAAAGIHPGALLTDRQDSPHHDLDTVRGELYFLFAERDEYAPAQMVDQLRREIESRGIVGTVERAPGTYHGFSLADAPAYQQEASERHFAATLELWARAKSQPIGPPLK